VAPKATIMAVRVGENLRAISAGLEFAIDHGADIISLSSTEKRSGPLGIVPEPDNFGWRAYCENILALGVLHANSTGKNGLDVAVLPIPLNIGPPGSCPPPRLHPLQAPRGGVSSAISCGATDDLDNLDGPSGKGPVAWDSLPFVDYPFSLGGPQGLIKPDLCAPGVGTTSCSSEFSVGSATNPYVTFTGTSPATAYVSGSLALLLQACKRSGKPVVAAHIQQALETKAVHITGQTQAKENNYGAGRLDVYAAFKYGVCQGWWS
jgi:subtilisin family serine protease